jgi:peptidoglycan-associated lipoprotein
MLNKYIIGSAMAAALILTGCSSKTPTVDTTAQKTETTANTGASSSTTSTATANAVVDAVADAQAKVQSVLFDFDKFNIRADMQPVVEGNAKLTSALTEAKVKLEGNTDERGTDEYNYALGLKRANSVKAAYVAKGIAEAKMSTVSLGEGNAVCKESTEECWAKNRRVDTKLEK